MSFMVSLIKCVPKNHNCLFWGKLSEHNGAGLFWAMPKTKIINFPEDVPKIDTCVGVT